LCARRARTPAGGARALLYPIAEVMRLLAACRGAINSLHAEAANDLIEVVHSYFK